MRKDNIPYQLSYETNMAWIDPATKKMPHKQRAGGIDSISNTGKIKYKSLPVLEQELNEITKEVGRYNIDFMWKNSQNGHIICFERLKDGSRCVYDPQVGKKVRFDNLLKMISLKTGVSVLRVDNMWVNANIVSGIVKKR